MLQIVLNHQSHVHCSLCDIARKEYYVGIISIYYQIGIILQHDYKPSLKSLYISYSFY